MIFPAANLAGRHRRATSQSFEGDPLDAFESIVGLHLPPKRDISHISVSTVSVIRLDLTTRPLHRPMAVPHPQLRPSVDVHRQVLSHVLIGQGHV